MNDPKNNEEIILNVISASIVISLNDIRYLSVCSLIKSISHHTFFAFDKCFQIKPAISNG